MDDFTDFVPIKGHEKYLISPDGRVFSTKKRKKFLKHQLNTHGYYEVTLDGKHCTLHRLIATHFIPNPQNYPVINHKDENPQNNSIDNLEWCDSKYNANYGNRNKKISEKHHRLKSKVRHKVVCIDEKNCRVIIFPSLTSTEEHGFYKQAVRGICKHYKHFITHRGCKFMYYEDWIRGDTQ